MKHTNNNAIFSKAGKKATAIFVAASFVVTGAIATVVNFIKGNDYVDNTIPTEMGTSAEDPMNKLLVLTEPFDIYDATSVEARANAIWKISEKKYDELDIANLIYILAGKKELINYPASANTDSLKFKYLQELAVGLGSLLDDDILDYTNAASSGAGYYNELSAVSSGYMYMPGKIEEGELVQTKGQKKAIDLTRMCLVQKDAIIKNDQETLNANAKNFYHFYKSIEDMKINDFAKFVLYKQVQADAPIYTMFLTKKQAEEIDNVTGIIASYQNNVFQAAAQGLDISEILSEGNFGKDVTPHGESYNAEDAKDAITHPAVKDDNSKSTTKVVDEGGKKLPSQSQVITQSGTSSTTKTETTTFVVEPTTGKVKVTLPNSDEEFVVDITGEGTYEYTIPGGNSVGDIEYYDADDAKEAEKLGNTYTLG